MHATSAVPVSGSWGVVEAHKTGGSQISDAACVPSPARAATGFQGQDGNYFFDVRVNV